MPKLHVVLKKEELDPSRLRGKTVIVLDVPLGATGICSVYQ